MSRLLQGSDDYDLLLGSSRAFIDLLCHICSGVVVKTVPDSVARRSIVMYFI